MVTEVSKYDVLNFRLFLDLIYETTSGVSGVYSSSGRPFS